MVPAIIILALALVVLVGIHEFGHFLMAKKFGIKVLEFGFGIPPKIWGKKIGETILSINALPVGGFVRLLGEDEVDKEILENHRSFAFQKVSKRIIVVVAGILMNLILSWLLFYIVIFSQGFRAIIPTPTPEVIISSVENNSPASQAKLQIGDRVLSVNNQRIDDEVLFSEKIKQLAGKSVTLEISDLDGNNLHQIEVTPRVNPPPGQGSLGVGVSPFLIKSFSSLEEKVLAGPIYSFDLSKMILSGFGDLFNNLFAGNFSKASVEVSGPVGIAVASNQVLSLGIIPYLWFMGYLSLTLALINFIPFPGLDGGRLLFLVIEGITRKRIHVTIEKYVHSIGLAILIGLVVLVTISDIKKLI